jgi:hypothetical protein
MRLGRVDIHLQRQNSTAYLADRADPHKQRETTSFAVVSEAQVLAWLRTSCQGAGEDETSTHVNNLAIAAGDLGYSGGGLTDGNLVVFLCLGGVVYILTDDLLNLGWIPRQVESRKGEQETKKVMVLEAPACHSRLPLTLVGSEVCAGHKVVE